MNKKINKKIILISTFVVLGILFLNQTVCAANPTLSFLPTIASENIGTVFNLTVQVNPQGNKVCVVKGTLEFNNLACQSITLAPNLMAQTNPTCTNPNFIIGIPKCATATQGVLTISVQGNKVGQAKASFTKSSVIGVGVLIPSDSQGGVYTITAPLVLSKSSLTPTPVITEPSPLFDVVSEPVPATSQKSIIPLIIFSAVVLVLFLLFIVFIICRIKSYIILNKNENKIIK